MGTFDVFTHLCGLSIIDVIQTPRLMSKYKDVRFCSEHLMYDANTGSLYDPNTIGERRDQLKKLLVAELALY